MNCTHLLGAEYTDNTKALVEGNSAFYAEWRCVSGATPAFDLYFIQSKVVR